MEEMHEAECRDLSDAELDGVVGGTNALREIGEAVIQAVRDARPSTQSSISLRWGI